MRAWPFLLVLSVAACGGDSGMTRNFSVSRNAAPETMASTRVPLSTPPELATRPTRPITLGDSTQNTQMTQNTQPTPDQGPGSAGEEALLEAAGPTPDPNVRAQINENAGLVYPSPEFADRLLNWTPPPGHTPIINQASKGGSWFSRIF